MRIVGYMTSLALLQSRGWQLRNVWREYPAQNFARLALWFCLCIVAPIGVRISSERSANAAMQFVLSFDVPLVLAFAGIVAGVLMPALAAAVAKDADCWILPARYQGNARHLSVAVSCLQALMWPFGILAAVAILGLGNSSKNLPEIYLMFGLGALLGSIATYIFSNRRFVDIRVMPLWPSLGQGMTQLSWAPLRQLADVVQPRQLSRLAIPAMLAAPMGASATDVAAIFAVLFPVICCEVLVRATATVAADGRRWLPSRQLSAATLAHFSMRYVAVFFACSGLLVSAGIFLAGKSVLMSVMPLVWVGGCLGATRWRVRWAAR
jgi:hypothetical protein